MHSVRGAAHAAHFISRCSTIIACCSPIYSALFFQFFDQLSLVLGKPFSRGVHLFTKFLLRLKEFLLHCPLPNTHSRAQLHLLLKHSLIDLTGSIYISFHSVHISLALYRIISHYIALYRCGTISKSLAASHCHYTHCNHTVLTLPVPSHCTCTAVTFS